MTQAIMTMLRFAVSLCGLYFLVGVPTPRTDCIGNPACALPCKPGYYRDEANCFCEPVSPIIIDVDGRGFFLTNAANGVQFDMTGTGRLMQIAWTAPGSTNAFLAMDRNGDGIISDGTELFGNFTSQPPSENPNGFLALAVFDAPENGGNGDGIIDSRDKVFGSLRLWTDINHDGICQPNELRTLPVMGVNSIALSYRILMKHDQYGNLFRYAAKVNGRDTSDVGRIAYDVFLTTPQ
jgi:hypothetical protein